MSTLAGGGASSTFTDGVAQVANFQQPYGVAILPMSNSIIVADTQNSRLRLMTYPSGTVTTLAGSYLYGNADGTGSDARFFAPLAVANFPISSAIAVSDGNNYIIRLVSIPLALPACDSSWHHVALAYAPSALPATLSAYLDGALIYSSAALVTLPARAASTLRVGWSGDLARNGGSLFAGSVSDLRI